MIDICLSDIDDRLDSTLIKEAEIESEKKKKERADKGYAVQTTADAELADDKVEEFVSQDNKSVSSHIWTG